MEGLTRYIVVYYPGLMTEHERLAHRCFIAQEKSANLEPESPMIAMYRRRFGTEDPAVLALMEKGSDEFLRSVAERILREHSDEVFLNYCPKCGALTNTPMAKQCPKCFHSWHDS